jgi:protein ImuB
MAFACMYVPDFLLQSAVRGEPELRECAMALIGGVPPLWSVVAVNAAAWQAGIRPGMTKSQAAQFCGVKICQRQETQECAAHAALLDVGWSVSPRVEDTATDSIVVDLHGLEKLFGSEEKIAQELAQRVFRVGLLAHVAVSANIEVSILAARGFPGITVIPAGEERKYLGGLPVSVLAGDGDILETLGRWGVGTLEALATLPVLQLSERLGQKGVRLHELARGACARSLEIAEPVSSFQEEMELDDSVEELEPLSFLLGRLLDQLCARFEARALAVRALHVRFDLQPSVEQDFQLLENLNRQKPAAKRYSQTLALPVAMRDSKMLLRLLRLLLESDPPQAPIQKIILTADSAAPRAVPGGLFVPAAPDPEKLELTLARLLKLVGHGNLGSPSLLDSHRPGHFQMEKFRVSSEPSEKRRKNPSLAGERKPLGSFKPMAGFRVLRPSLPIDVEWLEQQPLRVRVQGMCGDVVAASGPWRSSGAWWQEDAWNQNEWDLAIAFGSAARPTLTDTRKNQANPLPEYGIYRVYYDALRQSWFVRGVCD